MLTDNICLIVVTWFKRKHNDSIEMRRGYSYQLVPLNNTTVYFTFLILKFTMLTDSLILNSHSYYRNLHKSQRRKSPCAIIFELLYSIKGELILQLVCLQ